MHSMRLHLPANVAPRGLCSGILCSSLPSSTLQPNTGMSVIDGRKVCIFLKAWMLA